MIIDTPFVPITIPKSGSSTIKHWHYRRIFGINGNIPHNKLHDEYNKITHDASLPRYLFVRNPISRVDSMYCGIYLAQSKYKNLKHIMSYVEFVDFLYENKNKMKLMDKHYHPATSLVSCDVAGVFKIENSIQTGLDCLCDLYKVERTEIDNRNITLDKTCKTDKTYDILRKIVSIYKDDFILGGYDIPSL